MDETLKVYGRIDGLLEDIAQAYRQVISGFAAAGCRYLQFDDCTWGMLCDEKFRCNPQVNAEEMALLFARINEMALNSRPEGMTITMHVCRGNYHSAWASWGGMSRLPKPYSTSRWMLFFSNSTTSVREVLNPYASYRTKL